MDRTLSRLGPRLARLCLVAAALLTPTAPAAAQGACEFKLGFELLADRIPDAVGRCLENEHHNPANGDALQRTTGGLLVWRKADNFTAFTDGARTWVNGPFGIQQRSNEQRFFWEPNPERRPIVPPPVPGDRCHTAGLALDLVGSDVGAGNIVATFRFTNATGVPCTLEGFVGAQLLDAQDNPLPTAVARGGGRLAAEPGPRVVRLPAGGTALFRMHWAQVPVGNETSCSVSARMAIIPPDEFAPLLVDVAARACGGGRLDVGAVQPSG
jgi:hypothetical protein